MDSVGEWVVAPHWFNILNLSVFMTVALNHNSHKPSWFQLFYFCPLYSFVTSFIGGGKIAMPFQFLYVGYICADI